MHTLLNNEIRGHAMRDYHNKTYKLFSNSSEGKDGRFRETMRAKGSIIWDGLSLLSVFTFSTSMWIAS